MRHFHYECCHSLSYSADHAGAAWLTDLAEAEAFAEISRRDDPGARFNGEPVTRRGGKKADPAPSEPRREVRIPDSGSQLSPGGVAAAQKPGRFFVL